MRTGYFSLGSFLKTRASKKFFGDEEGLPKNDEHVIWDITPANIFFPRVTSPLCCKELSEYPKWSRDFQA